MEVKNFLNEPVNTGDYFFSKSFGSGYKIVGKEYTGKQYIYKVLQDGQTEPVFMPEQIHRINVLNHNFVRK